MLHRRGRTAWFQAIIGPDCRVESLVSGCTVVRWRWRPLWQVDRRGRRRAVTGWRQRTDCRCCRPPTTRCRHARTPRTCRSAGVVPSTWLSWSAADRPRGRPAAWALRPVRGRWRRIVDVSSLTDLLSAASDVPRCPMNSTHDTAAKFSTAYSMGEWGRVNTKWWKMTRK